VTLYERREELDEQPLILEGDKSPYRPEDQRVVWKSESLPGSLASLWCDSEALDGDSIEDGNRTVWPDHAERQVAVEYLTANHRHARRARKRPPEHPSKLSIV
jgi:hypothetical protein